MIKIRINLKKNILIFECSIVKKWMALAPMIQILKKRLAELMIMFWYRKPEAATVARKSHWKCFVEKTVFKKCRKIDRKTPVLQFRF